MPDKIHFILTGGTIDSVYHPPTETSVPADRSIIPEYLNDAIKPYDEYTFETLCMLDSGDVTDAHRESMVQSITSNTADKFIICHGTNTLIETAQYLAAHFLIKDTDKTIILTGAIIPLKQFILSDGGFNLGYAVGQSYNLSSGVHICMHGKIFLPQNVTKNRAEARFEEL